MGLSGTVAASAASEKAGPADHRMTVKADNQLAALPWLDSATIRAFTPPLVFTVSENNGVPFINDPRSTPNHWQNLRRVPGSQGGVVTNITIAEDATSTALAPVARITARTNDSNIFFTLCTLTSALPQTGPLPCTTWQPLPA